VQIDRARVTGEQDRGGADRVIEPLMTADEVAAALGVNRKFVYARVHAGKLRGYKLGSQYRFRAEDVREFVEASVAAPDAAPQVRERPRRAAPSGSFRALLEGRAA
jgi:excisionase family DNA binding protein